MKFLGYRRPDGQVGVRNYVAVIPTVFCADKVAEVIARQVSGAICMRHNVGCSQVGKDFELTARTLKGMAAHPNVGAVLIVGLGCERFTPQEFYDDAILTGKPVEKIIIQDEGDTLATIEKGTRIANAFAAELDRQQRVECDLSEITIGLKCGGTDAFSGIAANPALGNLSDRLVGMGGSAILSELNELLGTEDILARRAVSPEVRQQIYDVIYAMEDQLRRVGADPRYQHRGALISTGNFDGGVSTVVEKALGGMHKAGESPVSGVIKYSERLNGRRGLFLMDSCSHDGEVVTGMVGAGAQIVCFTSGRGTPTGFPIAPVIKITGNTETYEKMKENIDVNTGAIVEGTSTIEEEGAQMLELLARVASGEKTKAELLGHDELFCITRALGV